LKAVGGFGKTTLAQKLCFDKRVRKTYPDGILWVTMGEEVTEDGRLAKLRDLIRWWTEKEVPAFQTVEAVSAALRRVLENSRVLIVLDNVWNVADLIPFKGLGKESALLITTRVADLLPERATPIYADEMVQDLYLNLAIFPENENIPLAVLECYWELSRSATRRLCGQLNDLSLLREFDPSQEFISLRDVDRRKLMDLRKQELPSLHSHFLNLMCPASGRWQDLSADQIYGLKKLSYHFIGSGRDAELQGLLSPFAFLEAKLIATDVNTLLADYEHLVRKNQELGLIREMRFASRPTFSPRTESNSRPNSLAVFSAGRSRVFLL
jgi:hypothetical protein